MSKKNERIQLSGKQEIKINIINVSGGIWVQSINFMFDADVTKKGHVCLRHIYAPTSYHS